MELRIVPGKRRYTDREIKQALKYAMAKWAAKKRKPAVGPGSATWEKYLGHFGPPRRKKKPIANKKAVAKKRAAKKKTKKSTKKVTR
jgi:hypothetical protein